MARLPPGELHPFLHFPLLMVFSPCLEESLIFFVRLVEDKMCVWCGWWGGKRGKEHVLKFLFCFFLSLNAFRF